MAKERRRRAYLPAGIVVLAVLGGGQYYLSNVLFPSATGSDSGSTGVPGAGNRPPGALNAGQAVQSVYAAVANNEPESICPWAFAGQGEQQFAHDFGSKDCSSTVVAESKKVTDARHYASMSVPTTAVHATGPLTAMVYSCAIGVANGDSLGTFLLTKEENGWFITGHEPDPATCPPAPSS